MPNPVEPNVTRKLYWSSAPPTMCILDNGLFVPIPTLPDASIRMLSTPPSEKAIVSAAGKKIPVFKSPTVVIEGAVTEPFAKDTAPLTDTIAELASAYAELAYEPEVTALWSAVLA